MSGFTITNGKNKNLNSKYNALYLEYPRILKAKRPQCFLVENAVWIKAKAALKTISKSRY